MPKRISILGSTGSIGVQALEVASAHPEAFEIVALTALGNASLLADQALRFHPRVVVIGDDKKVPQLRQALHGEKIEILAGVEGLCRAASLPEADMVLTATVGFSGLEPTLAAIDAGKEIALANKETLVVAGRHVMARAKAKGVRILPVDSEHSAIFQCLEGEERKSVRKITLTASGGPFRGFSAEQIGGVTVKQALKHPNWSMGAKITVDSASMMNKGLEAIEARWLFGLAGGQIDMVVHPQSIIHSTVEFADGSLKAQMGLPDMRLPIQYALAWPKRLYNDFPRFSFADYPNLTFEPVDRNVFRAVDFAYQAMADCGNRPCALNAANEIAVEAFLKEKINFTGIYDCIEFALNKVSRAAEPSLDDLFQTDEEARARAREFAY